VNAGSLRASLGIDAVVLEDVRAAGALLVARVPELIERFYAWLADSPEFERFFAADPALLARVKRHQTAYWCDFLAADVDEEYVERRRVVGDTHGRIELGLLVYLRAMELIATWFVEQTEADDRLRRERPTIAFSIRKLIQFDSAIVVNTYAVRTVKMLDAQRARLEHVARVMRAVTAGDLEHRVELAGADDLLGSSVNDMVASLRMIAREMRMIARAELSADVVPRSDRDELGAALQAMTKALREAAERNDRHMWRRPSRTRSASCARPRSTARSSISCCRTPAASSCSSGWRRMRPARPLR
jgi:hypothetical protein